MKNFGFDAGLVDKRWIVSLLYRLQELSALDPGGAIVMPVVDGTEIEDAEQLIAEGRVGSYRDIFAAGLVAVLERRLDS